MCQALLKHALETCSWDSFCLLTTLETLLKWADISWNSWNSWNCWNAWNRNTTQIVHADQLPGLAEFPMALLTEDWPKSDTTRKASAEKQNDNGVAAVFSDMVLIGKIGMTETSFQQRNFDGTEAQANQTRSSWDRRIASVTPLIAISRRPFNKCNCNRKCEWRNKKCRNCASVCWKHCWTDLHLRHQTTISRGLNDKADAQHQIFFRDAAREQGLWITVSHSTPFQNDSSHCSWEQTRNEHWHFHLKGCKCWQLDRNNFDCNMKSISLCLKFINLCNVVRIILLRSLQVWRTDFLQVWWESHGDALCQQIKLLWVC